MWIDSNLQTFKRPPFLHIINVKKDLFHYTLDIILCGLVIDVDETNKCHLISGC
jgi:hypothetical protein